MPFSSLHPAPVKVKNKLHEKTIIKLQILARLELQNLGMTDAALALHLGVKTQVVTRLKRTLIYGQIKSQLLSGIMSDMDESITNNYNLNRKILKSAVPTALENLVALAAQKIDKSLQFKASQEILDREGSFTKVSRQVVTVNDINGFASEEDNSIAKELIAAARLKKEKDGVDISTPPVISSVQ
jgi:hypothetical protein